MLPKIASALARVLDPIRPIDRPGETISFSKSSDAGEGGHGTLGYEAKEKLPEAEAQGEDSALPERLPEDGLMLDASKKAMPQVPFRPGLTQVILDLQASRAERGGGSAAQTYETGAKEQKKNARLPKGSMLDKKVG